MRRALLVFSLAACVGPETARDAPEIRYELTHDPGAACWRVRLLATGIDARGGEVRLVLADWGEWTEVFGYHLREFEARPSVRKDSQSPHSFTLELPASWDGTLEASYAIGLAPHGTATQQAHPLLPTHTDGDAAGFSRNTFFEVTQAAKPLAAARRIRFAAPEGTTIATGWGGVSPGAQEVAIDHPIDNVPLCFGQPSGFATAEDDGLRYEIVQFGPGPDGSGEVLRVARALVPLYGRNAGRPYDEVVRVFVTPLCSGGTHTDHGCIVSYGASDFENVSSDFQRLLAHELFHIWLGGYLAPPEEESLVWFLEGFTEYLAMWHVVAARLAEPEWFAERVLSHEAEARSSEGFGRVAFADPGVRWRDGNGPNETLAYKGGSTLALLADVELRRQGRPGLMQLVADLLRGGGPLTRAAVREWMEANGLGPFWAQFVAKPGPWPRLGPALTDMHFEATESDAALTYLGIQTGDGDATRTIVALDPNGPAARAGFAIGDRILGCSPGRMHPPDVRASVETPYRFGLNIIASGAKVATIDVERAGNRLELSLEPRLIAGGVRTSYRRGRTTFERFFRYEPPAQSPPPAAAPDGPAPSRPRAR